MVENLLNVGHLLVYAFYYRIMASVETLIERACITGEGPHWDERTGQLLYVDINNFSVHRWTAATGKNEKHKFGMR